MAVRNSILLLMILALFTQCEEKERRPNVLLIFVDDLGKEWISAYGTDSIQTPNIDHLAETGLKFENFYVNPQCTPSRMSLFTGQYPFRHGWVNHWDVPRWGGGAHYDWTVNPGIGKVIKDAGYMTAAVGKWQVNDFRVQPKAMQYHGFDDWCMWTGYETGNPESSERYWNPYLNTREGSKSYSGKFGEDVFADFLIDFMNEHKSKPLFMYYAMCLTHTPFTSTPLEPNVIGSNDRHKAMVKYMDIIVGRLVQALEEQGLRENTIIVFTTDNGTTGKITGTLEGHEIVGAKSRMTEAGSNMPFIVNCPGLVPEGKTTNALSDLTDLMPTFAQLAGGTLPDQYTYDGVSIADFILGESDDTGREWILSMGGGNNAALSENGVENQFIFRDRVIRNQRYKLYVSNDRQPEKLFDLEIDPFEENNLINSENPDHITALNNLWKPIADFPIRDNDPKYVALDPQPWDVEVTVSSQVWKE